MQWKMRGYIVSPCFLPNWRVFGIGGYVDIKDITRFITIHNLEDWVIMLDIARRLYYTDIAVEHNTDVGTRVHISRGH